MADEMRFHLEERAEAERDGADLPPAEAEQAAKRRFGNVGLIQETARDERAYAWVDGLRRDLRFALRALRKNPGFTGVAVVTLALGIGANTALFSAFSALVLHPLSFPRPERLVRLWSSNASLNFEGPVLSWPRYEFIRDHQTSFSGVAAATYTGFTVTRPDAPPEDVNTLAVSANFFSTLGIEAWRGRSFAASEDVRGGPKVVMVSYEYWQRALAGRESAVGQAIRLNDEPYTIVGITPPAVSNPYRTVVLYVPRVFDQRTPADVQRGMSFLEVTGRLRPGVTLAQAAGEMTALAADYRAALPGNSDTQMRTRVVSFADELVGNLRPTFLFLIAAVGFVLLIACANVVALLLGRLHARHQEIAVRLALGASRLQLLRQFLVEGSVFAMMAGALGIALARGTLAWIARSQVDQIPAGVQFALDPGVLAFTAGGAVFAALFIGLTPAFFATRAERGDALKDAGRRSSSGAGGARFRSALMVVEVALSVVLLVLSGLFLTSIERLRRAPAGFTAHGIATALVSLPPTRYRSGPAQARFYTQLVERLEAQPQVRQAAVAIGAPLTGYQVHRAYGVAGRPILPPPERPLANLDVVTEDYFATLEIGLRAGRAFDARDDERATKKCMISESFARRLFPGESPLGKFLLHRGNADEPCEIIGVVADVKSAGLTASPPDEMYLSMRQYPWQLGVLLVRTDGDPLALQSVIRSTVAGIDPNQPIAEFATLDFLVAQSLQAQYLAAWLTGGFAGVALLLSSVGLYSVLAYTVSRRTAEIGVRMALGARPTQVVALVMGGGLRLVGLGLALGLAAAGGTAFVIRTLLFEVPPLDPLIYAGVAALFVVIAALACLLPSLRASRIDPLLALRAE
jgi:predicted permease